MGVPCRYIEVESGFCARAHAPLARLLPSLLSFKLYIPHFSVRIHAFIRNYAQTEEADLVNMSTFDGVVKEFPDIRIDYFRPSNSQSRPPLAYFLSHVHSDHLVSHSRNFSHIMDVVVDFRSRSAWSHASLLSSTARQQRGISCCDWRSIRTG